MIVYCAMRMLNAMTLMAVMSVCVGLVTQEMDSTAQVIVEYLKCTMDGIVCTFWFTGGYNS